MRKARHRGEPKRFGPKQSLILRATGCNGCVQLLRADRAFPKAMLDQLLLEETIPRPLLESGVRR